MASKTLLRSPRTPAELKVKLRTILVNQKRLQAARLEREKELSGQISQLGKTLKKEEGVSKTRIGSFRARNQQMRTRNDQLGDLLSVTTPLAAIATEIAAIRELTERAQSDADAGKVLIERSPAAIDRIGIAAAQAPAAAVKQPNLRTRLAAFANSARSKIQDAEDQAEQEREERLGEATDDQNIRV